MNAGNVCQFAMPAFIRRQVAGREGTARGAGSVVRGIDETQLVNLVAETAMETGDLPSSRRGIGHGIRGGSASRQGPAQVGGELYIEYSGMAILLALGHRDLSQVFVAGQGERLGGAAGAAVSESGAIGERQTDLIDAGTGADR